MFELTTLSDLPFFSGMVYYSYNDMLRFGILFNILDSLEPPLCGAGWSPVSRDTDAILGGLLTGPGLVGITSATSGAATGIAAIDAPPEANLL